MPSCEKCNWGKGRACSGPGARGDRVQADLWYEARGARLDVGGAGDTDGLESSLQRGGDAQLRELLGSVKFSGVARPARWDTNVHSVIITQSGT